MTVSGLLVLFCLIFIVKNIFLLQKKCLHLTLTCRFQGRCMNFTRVQSRWRSNVRIDTFHFIPFFGQRRPVCALKEMNVGMYIVNKFLYLYSVFRKSFNPLAFVFVKQLKPYHTFLFNYFVYLKGKIYISLFTKAFSTSTLTAVDTYDTQNNPNTEKKCIHEKHFIKHMEHKMSLFS